MVLRSPPSTRCKRHSFYIISSCLSLVSTLVIRKSGELRFYSLHKLQNYIINWKMYNIYTNIWLQLQLNTPNEAFEAKIDPKVFENKKCKLSKQPALRYYFHTFSHFSPSTTVQNPDFLNHYFISRRSLFMSTFFSHHY